MFLAVDSGSLIIGAIITLVVGVIVLSIFFRLWYYTYHGDLPEKFIGFLIMIILIIGLLTLGYFLLR